MKTGAAILDKVLQGAISRQEYRRLNWLLTRAVPFNRPHGLRITALSQTVAQVEMPYKRRNYNHLKGMHAAAICALGEFPAGLLLLANLPARKYRLILAKLEAEYHLQGRSDLHAQVSWPVENSVTAIQTEITENGSTEVRLQTRITDSDAAQIATVTTTWQLKDWKKVRLR